MKKLARFSIVGFQSALVSAFFAMGLCRAAEADNPMKQARVGDWVLYESSMEISEAGKQTTTTKMTVKSVNEKEVTVLIEQESTGTDGKRVNDVVIPLEKYEASFNWHVSNIKDDGNIVYSRVSSGKENIVVAGKTLSCEWTESSMTPRELGFMKSASGIMKAWFCADVPLNGMGKREQAMSVDFGEGEIKTHVLMQLKDYGIGQK